MNSSFAIFAKDLIKEGDEPKFGCLMAMVSPELSSQFVEWTFDHVDPDEVVPDNGKTGYEDEPHVTVLYGFHPGVTHDEVFAYIKDFGPITLTLGKISKFKQEDQDVLKVDVESKDLHEFNALLQEKFAGRFDNKYPDYHPHMTLAYVKKGIGEDIDPETFEGFEMTITNLVYSYGGGEKKVTLNLAERVEEAIYGEPDPIYNPGNKKAGEFVSAAAVKDLETGDIYIAGEHTFAFEILADKLAQARGEKYAPDINKELKNRKLDTGFITNKHRYLSRKEAMELARARKQISPDRGGELDSTDFA